MKATIDNPLNDRPRSTNMKVLIVCLRRLGDVLLTTPLAASVRSAYSHAEIHWLVFESTRGILQDNPAADRVIALADNPTALETWRALKKVAFSYQLAFSAQAGDRPALFARLASRHAYALASKAQAGFIRDVLMTAVASNTAIEHQVAMVLSLCDSVGIAPKSQVLCPAPAAIALVVKKVMAHFSLPESGWPQRYWVLHPGAAFVYKQWSVAGWRELAQWLMDRRVGILISGGTSIEEAGLLEQLFCGRVPGHKFLPIWQVGLSWPELASVLQHAQGFVGVDTSVTHLAAALGVPSYPLFGPTNPKIWAPLSPDGTKHKPIPVIQNQRMPCVPCQLEGCHRHVYSRSDCLDTLTSSDVIDFIRKRGSV